MNCFWLGDNRQKRKLRILNRFANEILKYKKFRDGKYYCKEEERNEEDFLSYINIKIQ